MKNLLLVIFTVSFLACTKEELKSPYSKEDMDKIIANPFKYGIKAAVVTHTELDTLGEIKRITVSANKRNLYVSTFTVNDTIIPKVNIDTNAYVFQIFPNNPKFRLWSYNLKINLNDQTIVVKPLQLSFDNLPSVLKLKDEVVLPTHEGEITHHITIAEHDQWSNLLGKILYKKRLETNTLLFDDELVKTLKIGQRLVILHHSTESQIIDEILYTNICYAISRSFIFSN